MKRLLLLAGVAVLASLAVASAIVVRPAPAFSWTDASGKLQSLGAFKGQPVVLIIAPSPRSWIFRSQVGQLQRMYERFAANKVIFVAAFTQEPGLIRSNIPFVVAADPPRIAQDYEAGNRFAIAFIGRDGNLDYVTNRVVPAQRIYDILGASFAVQEAIRRP